MADMTRTQSGAGIGMIGPFDGMGRAPLTSPFTPDDPSVGGDQGPHWVGDTPQGAGYTNAGQAIYPGSKTPPPSP